MFEQEKIYIAGPECFYKNGPAMLKAMEHYAKSKGFQVTLPNSHPLDMENPDLQKRADSIFQDLKQAMKETTIIIADLEAYRGAEADSGTVYEMGMAYADRLRCYGYTRDKRPLAWKDPRYVRKDGVVYDERNQPAPYSQLPFSPTVAGSAKIAEGTFKDCLSMVMADLEEEWRAAGRGEKAAGREEKAAGRGEKAAGREKKAEAGKKAYGKGKPVVYLADLVRYRKDAKEEYARIKELCAAYGLKALTPLDWAEGMEGPGDASLNPYGKAARMTENYLQLVKSCDGVIADLNPYRGYECANDIGFECGMGFELGKKLYGYMADARPCIEKIPHMGEKAGFRDMAGNSVENFNYPANLMFACSMDIWEGTLESVLGKVAKDLAAR